MAEVPAGVIERPGDLTEGQAETAERADSVEAGQVSIAVEPVPGRAATRRDEQSDLLVVVQRADGQPTGVGDVTDPPPFSLLQLFVMSGTVRPDVT